LATKAKKIQATELEKKIVNLSVDPKNHTIVEDLIKRKDNEINALFFIYTFGILVLNIGHVSFSTFSLSKKVQKEARLGKFTINFTWHIKFLSNIWNCREDISEHYRTKF
jgi:hypothetical protein